MGGFFLGAGLLRRVREMDCESASGVARGRCRSRAILTSSLEWLVLVPLFPFWQPIFTLQQPYWIGFLVHLSSASMYPFFAWLYRSPSERQAFEGRIFLRVWSLGAVAGILLLGIAALLAAYHRELPWVGAGSGDRSDFYPAHGYPSRTRHSVGIDRRREGRRSTPSSAIKTHGSEPEGGGGDTRALVGELVRRTNADMFGTRAGLHARPTRHSRG